MITPSFALTATERVLPKLALDFTTAALDSRVTFTRTTSTSNPATYVNSSGYITAATDNQPRFDYDPVTLVCKGLLIEESRKNLVPYSNQFDQTGTAFWIPARATVNATAGTSPDGTNDSYSVMETAVSGSHYVGQASLATVSGTTYTGSCYIKANGRTWAVIQMVGSAVFPSANINLTTGAIGTINGTATATSTNAGNGWWRVTITAATDTTSSQLRILCGTGDNANSYLGDVTKGILVYGAQLEAGAFATSYIPNVGNVTNTRNADVATMTGTNFSDWYNASEGSIVAKYNTSQIPVTDSRIFYISDGTLNNFIQGFCSASTNYIVGNVTTSGVPQGGYTGLVSASLNASNKLSIGFKLNNFAGSSNGGSIQTDSNMTIPSVNQMTIGSHPVVARSLNGHIEYIYYYPLRLTNSELQAFSK